MFMSLHSIIVENHLTTLFENNPKLALIDSCQEHHLVEMGAIFALSSQQIWVCIGYVRHKQLLLRKYVSESIPYSKENL